MGTKSWVMGSVDLPKEKEKRSLRVVRLHLKCFWVGVEVG